jgi:HAD superfamily hydrolase (TIGR01549 family)
MAKWRVIFFDVGNTLLFPNRAKMLAPISADLHPTLEAWQEFERRTKKEFDEGMVGGTVDHGFWWTFHTYLLEDLGHDFSVRDEMVANTQNSANWDEILPGTREALDRIAQNFRIAVISNADGGIERVLSRCNIADCFESITDSGIVGIEKPRVVIFEAALAAMNAKANESLYVGDVYSVDYLGARNAGMDAVLLDVSGAYRDRDLPRVETLPELESWLTQQMI